MVSMLRIDGDMGEGGGQILRTSLTLSLCLGRPVHLVQIRARRKNPGLQPQHLAAIRAAAAIGRADVDGATQGSQEVQFQPNGITAGEYRFDIGTAGSTSLLLQTVLPALLQASSPSQLTLLGGTHNPLAPPFEFLQYAYLPLLRRMGADVRAYLERPGFYPAGGGAIRVEVEPSARLQPLTLLERGEIQSLTAKALLAHLPEHIAQRELRVVQNALNLDFSQLQTRHLNESRSQGNALLLIIESTHCNEVISGFGRRGLRAEMVAEGVVQQARRYLSADVPVGGHLADQLLVLLALCGAGRYRTLEPDSHTRTNMDVIRAFTGAEVRCEQIDARRWELAVEGAQ